MIGQDMIGQDKSAIHSDAVNAPQSARVDGDETSAVAAALTNGLYLAATPTFAIMAVLTAVSGGHSDMLCSATQSPLGGMVPMYALMSAFHAGPWLKRMLRLGRACARVGPIAQIRSASPHP